MLQRGLQTVAKNKKVQQKLINPAKNQLAKLKNTKFGKTIDITDIQSKVTGKYDKLKKAAKLAGTGLTAWALGSTLSGSKDKKPTTPVEGGTKIPKKTKLGPPKGKLGSDYRKAEYDARGWKYDDTIAGYNRDGSKIKPTKTTTTKVVRKSITPTKQVVKTKTRNDQGKVTKVDKIKSKQYRGGEKKKDVTVAKDKVTGSYTKTKVKYNKDGTVKKNYTTNISGKKAARMKRRADRRANR